MALENIVGGRSISPAKTALIGILAGLGVATYSPCVRADPDEQAKIQRLETQVRSAPTFENHIELGRAYFRSRDYTQARREIEAALTIRPDDSVTKVDLSAILNMQEDHARALVLANEVLVAQPYNSNAMNNAGFAKYRIAQRTRNADSAREGLIDSYTALLIARAENAEQNARDIQSGIAAHRRDAQTRFSELYDETVAVEQVITAGTFPYAGPRDASMAHQVYMRVFEAGRAAARANVHGTAAQVLGYCAQTGAERNPAKRVARSLAERAAEQARTQPASSIAEVVTSSRSK